MRRNAHHVAALREHGWLIGLLAVYTGAVFLTAAALGRFPGPLAAPTSCIVFSGLILTVVFVAAMVRAALTDRRQPVRAVRRWALAWAREKGMAAIISSLALPILIAVFLMGKNLIPVIYPFSWDPAFAELDRMLHGTAAWELLQPVLGQPAITRVISYLYSFWFLLLFGAWIAWALSDHPERMRFLLSFTLCWIVLGTGAATAFSSAGPVFYAEVTGDDQAFAGLMRYLGEVDRVAPLPSLRIRDLLWRGYVGGTDEVAMGISAMPSLHVAIVTLCAISGWYVSRLVGVLMSLFAVLIFLGSVHLGWHYAVDGYVSVAATAGIWIGVGRLLHRRHERFSDDLLEPAVPHPVPSLVELSRLQ